MLLWRQTTPLLAVLASLNKVAVATPPTPPVLHTAALGASGPGWLGQAGVEQLVVVPKGHAHCALEMLHLPIGAQLGSNPGKPQATLVMLHTPGMNGQSTFELHAECVTAHVRIFAQQSVVWPWLQAVARHAGGGLILEPCRTPKRL